MTARLRFVEFVGWSTLPPQANYMGPYVELDSDDDSGGAVRHEIDGADVIAWTAVLINLAADATEVVTA